MIYWNVAPHMARKRWTNASQLARAAGIPKPAAYRVLHASDAGTPIARIDTHTLVALARAFHVKPWALLVYKAE